MERRSRTITITILQRLRYTSLDPKVVFPGWVNVSILETNNPSIDSSDELRELDIGRLELDSDLNSERNFEIARSWLCQCLRNHTTTLHDRQPKACGSPRKERLPTRVVDVGLDTGATPKLFISNGKSDDYIALSHCWGGGSGLTLTQENFRTLERAIPMRNAPANFKDAITITRKLGFRFIWIDSLCIIQDSGSDWETEAQRMGNVYKNATLTVAASGSPNTTAGILNRYSPAVSTSLKHDCRLPLEESGPGKVYLCRREPREESFVECLTSLPLATRGWALQEQMLAARTLYFGKRTIYWNCRSHQLSADHATANPFLNGYLPDAIPALFSNSNGREASDERDIYFRWLGIVNVYASRDLTKASDKLPAISGLAAEVSRLTGAKYLAGIWQEDLLNGLLWYPTLSQRNTENLLTGPSWSWVGVDTELQFATRERQRIYTPQDVEVIETETILEGQNIYGAVRSGHVKLKGLAHELWRSRDKYYRPDGDMNQYGYLWKDKDQNCEYTFDDRIDICEGFLPWVLPPINSVPSERDTIEGDWGLALILGVWSFGENDGPSSIDLGDPIEDDRLVVYALLLHPSGDVKEGTYKRVGILGFHSHSHFITETNWRIRQLKII